MEFASLILLLCIILSLLHLLTSTFRRRRFSKLPPGPNPLPIIGNILQLGPKPHQSLTNLSKIYGPLMHLKLGSIDTVVVSSPDIAKQILQHHDHGFPGRMTTEATKALGHHRSSVACLPVAKKWRILRRICREQMFSTQRLDKSRELRREKLKNLVSYVQECCDERKVVDIGEAAFVTTLNLISNTLFSVDFADYREGSSKELKETVRGLMEAFGKFNVADYFPIVGAFDPQWIKRDAECYIGKLFAVFDGIIDRRIEKKNDLLEALITQENQSELSRDDVKHLLLDLFIAGTDTTSSTVEWVMTEALRNENVVSKAKAELQIVMGQNKVLLEESDITKLPYLQAVIKETFRYHPPGPFIARRKDENEAVVGGFVVPANALVLINIWAIGRDSRIWRDPESFEPERFLEGEVDLKGQNWELIPFGAGRRICPGIPLAHRMVHLMVAALLHNFDWEFENGMRPEHVDVEEKFALSLHKAFPLKASCACAHHFWNKSLGPLHIWPFLYIWKSPVLAMGSIGPI